MNNKQYKLVLFDLDGTLLHSAPDVHLCINLALEKMHLTPIQYEQSIKAIGPGADSFSHIVLSPSQNHRLEEFLNIFQPIYREKCLDRTEPFDGIRELLDSLTNINLAVITNKSLITTNIILDGLKLLPFFKLVVGPESVKRIKPAPDMVEYSLLYFQIDSSEALVVGDTDNDIFAARSASVDVCAVGWGYADHLYLKSLEPEFFINKPLELLNIVYNNHNTEVGIIS